MNKLIKLILTVVFVLFGTTALVSKVSAQSDFIPDAPTIKILSNESHSYSYFVGEDGSADVWLRIDQINILEGIYGIELPKGAGKEIKAWYRDNSGGCIEGTAVESSNGSQGIEVPTGVRYDEMYPCKAEILGWNELKVQQSNNKISVNIPKSKKLNKNQKERIISLGLTWKMDNITNKKWWGREVNIETGKSDNYVSYEQVAVELPAGVYLRDKQVAGPTNWGEMMGNKSMMSQPQSGLDVSQQFRPDMFDSVGSGQTIKTKDNIAPGKNYSFVLLTSTSAWKLYIKEIGIMFGGAIVLILVASLLLRLVIGRKPLGWYIAVMLLVIVLVGIIIWMITIYQSIFNGGGIGGIPADYVNEGLLTK